MEDSVCVDSLCLYELSYTADVVYSTMLAAVQNESPDVAVYDSRWGRWANPDAWFPSVRLPSWRGKVKSEPPEATSSESSRTSSEATSEDCVITGDRSRADRDARGRENAIVLEASNRRRISFEEKRLDSLASALNDHLNRCMAYAADEDDKAACILAMSAASVSVQRVREELKRLKSQNIAERTLKLARHRKRQRYTSSDDGNANDERGDGNENGTDRGAECPSEVGHVSRDVDFGGTGVEDERLGDNLRNVEGERCDGSESGDGRAQAARA